MADPLRPSRAIVVGLLAGLVVWSCVAAILLLVAGAF